jgi:hypothetical protein
MEPSVLLLSSKTNETPRLFRLALASLRNASHLLRASLGLTSSDQSSHCLPLAASDSADDAYVYQTYAA